MCWIKQADRDGWMALNYTQNDDFWNKPDCANYPDRDWDDITLSCPPEGRYISTEIFQICNFYIPIWGLKNFLPRLNLESLKPFLLSDNSDEKMENYIIYIAGGVVGVLLLFCIIVFLFLVKF